jgi:hypothetical protein
MTSKDVQGEPTSNDRSLSRRKLLLASTTIAAASAVASTAPIQMTQAQQLAPPSAGTKAKYPGDLG